MPEQKDNDNGDNEDGSGEKAEAEQPQQQEEVKEEPKKKSIFQLFAQKLKADVKEKEEKIVWLQEAETPMY